MKIILDICHVTFSDLLLVDLSDCRYCYFSFLWLSVSNYSLHL